MSRSPDIMFMAEYIKNVLYFATVREGKTLKSNSETHYFSIDSELVYENYYSDFGPLNLGCVYKYCKILNDKLKLYLNKQRIVHYTTIDPKKKANAAFVLGCYGVLYLSLQPKDALKPLLVHGQSYRSFQDAIQGDSGYTISLVDCLNAITKANELGFFNFQDFNYEEYNRLDKIHGGDLNWIVPGKYLAFIGPVHYNVSLYHPPEMYVNYFLANNVKIVIRLNKRLYDGDVFNNAGINHYDLFFPDGSCPPRHILLKFLQISEESDGAIAVHCKAGLGRTGSLIGCYLMKHYRMTAHEAIGWMRICRPGSVIGHQQAWLEQHEAWLIKQGDLYRKRIYNDIRRLPYHEFGVYSISEKTLTQRPVQFQKSVCSTAGSKQMASVNPLQSQASKTKEGKSDSEEEEEFITSCDLTDKSAEQMTQIKGCIIEDSASSNTFDDAARNTHEKEDIPLWKTILCCKPCITAFKNGIWAASVRCANVTPAKFYTCRICLWLDMTATNKTKTESFDQWRMRPVRTSTQKLSKGKDHNIDVNSNASRRASGAGEPRPTRSPSKSSAKSPLQKCNAKLNESNNSPRNLTTGYSPPITTFRTTNGPIIRNVSDARNFLLKSSLHKEEREKQLLSSVTVTKHPHNYSLSQPINYTNIGHTNTSPHNVPSPFCTATRGPILPPQRRRLGRSPSPQRHLEQNRATNTPPARDKLLVNRDSKAALKEALSRLKLNSPRGGSIGAASLGARRDAPAPKRAPSVRSDERPLATQGDLLNSIKMLPALSSAPTITPLRARVKDNQQIFQRRLRDTLQTDKFHEKLSNPNSKDKLRANAPRANIDFNSRDKPGPATKNLFGPSRPLSPKGRRSPQAPTNIY